MARQRKEDDDTPRAPEDGAIVWFTSEDLQAMAADAQRLVEDPAAIQEVVSRRWMEDTEILHAAFRKIMDQIGDIPTLKGQIQAAMAALKIHDSKQEMTRPMMRRIMEAWKGKGTGIAGKRTPKQVSGHSGPSAGPRPIVGRGAGQSRLDPVPSEGGRPSEVDGGPVRVVLPVSEGPGYGGADSQDDRPEGQGASDQTLPDPS